MLDDFFNFESEHAEGTIATIANGCAKVVIVAIVGYVVLVISSIVLLIVLLTIVPADNILPKRKVTSTHNDAKSANLPIKVKVTTEVEVR